MSQLLDDLEAVDRLLDTDERWIQGTWAKCSLELPVQAFDSKAISWCLEGAAQHVVGPTSEGWSPQMWSSSRYRDLITALQGGFPKKFQGRDVPSFNDNGQTTFKVVKNAIKRAIATERAKQELVSA